MSEIIEVLRATPFFKGLTDEQFGVVVKACEQRSYPKGTVVINEKGDSDGMYIIVSGEVDVVRGGKLIAQLKENDFFGELALLKSKSRSATVQVTSDNLAAIFLPVTTFNYIKFGLAIEVLDEITRRIEENCR